MKMDMMLKEISILSLYYSDPVMFANKAYEKIKHRRESSEITPEQADQLLDVVFRHLWEVL